MTRRPPRYVYVTAARCPSCGSRRMRCYKTSRHGDDSVTRHVHCKDCLTKFRVVIE